MLFLWVYFYAVNYPESLSGGRGGEAGRLFSFCYSPKSKKYLFFQCGKDYYQYIALSYGLAATLSIFSKCMPVVAGP